MVTYIHADYLDGSVRVCKDFKEFFCTMFAVTAGLPKVIEVTTDEHGHDHYHVLRAARKEELL